MIRRALLAGLLMVGLAGPAAAFTPAQSLVLNSPPPYTGPGDITPFTAWYSCARAYSRAFAASRGALCNLRNVGSAETCDILAGSRRGKASITAACSGTSNGQTLAAFCTGGCAVTKMYDQTGGGRDILQATTANQPMLTVSCLGGLPCIVLNSASVALATSGTITPASGVVSLILVADRASGTGLTNVLLENGQVANSIRPVGSANTWRVGTGTLNATASDAAWHVGVGVVNGASAFLQIDGTSTTGTATGNTTAGTASTTGSASTTVDEVELGFKDATAFSAGTATSLCQNAQTAYGGSPNFAARC